MTGRLGTALLGILFAATFGFGEGIESKSFPSLDTLKSLGESAPSQAGPANGIYFEPPADGEDRLSESVGSIQIQGSPEFVAATREALVMLEKVGYLPEISKFIKVISQSKCSA